MQSHPRSKQQKTKKKSVWRKVGKRLTGHSKVEKLEATIAKQHKDFEAAIADLKGEIQKVSAQLEVSRPAPQTVKNNQ